MAHIFEHFLYLGNFLPVHVKNKNYVQETAIRRLLELLKEYTADMFLVVIEKVFKHEYYLPRKHELFCSFAAYLSSVNIAITEKEKVKVAFPNFAKKQEDLFLFVYYAKRIMELDKKKGFSKTIRKTISLWYKQQDAGKLLDFLTVNRGLHGLRHKDLLSICHLNLKKLNKEEFATACFKQPCEIVKEYPNFADENLSESMKKLINVSKLRVTEDPDIAKKLIKENNFKLEHVPMHFLKKVDIWNLFLPRLTYRQLLMNLHFLGECKMFGHNAFSRTYMHALSNQEAIKNEKVHPIKFLIERRKQMTLQRYSEKIKHSYYLKKIKRLGLKPNQVLQSKLLKIFHKSFDNLQGSGIRMFITINLQENYKKKFVSTHKQVTCYEAALTLAYSFFKSERIVQVYTYTEDSSKLKQIPWNEKMSYKEADEECAKLTRSKNFQRPLLPLVQADNSIQLFDLFLTIVPSIARGNPNNRPNVLLKRLKEYRKKNPNAKMVFVNLRRFRSALIHSEGQDPGIMEISNFDENTPKLITAFALNLFS